MPQSTSPEDIIGSLWSDSTRPRPDPLFKELTRQVAAEAGLTAKETEFSQTTRADLVLEVPLNVDLTNTLFDFFRSSNVVEFKSENDPLTLVEFLKQAVRVYLLFIQDPSIGFERRLSVIISARHPRDFLAYAESMGCSFVEDTAQPWFRRGRFGFQDVVIVNCERLPIEARYYPWLLFAPATTAKWRNFILELSKQDNQALLKAAQAMRPKEYTMVFKDLDKAIALYRSDPVEAARLEREEDEALEILLEMYRPQRHKKLLIKILQKANSPEERQILLESLLEKAGSTDEQALLDELIQRAEPDQLGQVVAKLDAAKRSQLLKLLQEQDQSGQTTLN